MSAPQSSSLAEAKYEDEGGRTIRFTKDDRKEQSAISRSGAKAPSSRFTEQIISDRPPHVTTSSLPHSGIQHVTGFEAGSMAPKGATTLQPGLGLASSEGENTNSALAPLVNSTELTTEKSSLHHVSQPSTNEFGSIHMSRGLSGDPLPSTTATDIGEAAAEGWETIKARAAPQIAKAKELFNMGKQAEFSTMPSSTSSSDQPGVIDRAKAVYETSVKPAAAKAAEIYQTNVAPQVQSGVAKAQSIFHENVQPQLESVQAKAKETVQAYQRKPSSSTTSTTTTRTARTYTSPSHLRQETLSHRLRRYRNKAIDIWEGNEPMVRSRMRGVMRWVRANKLEVPLLLLSTLLVLWASASFIQWIAFPKVRPEQEQIILYEAVKPVTVTAPGGDRLSEATILDDSRPTTGVIDQMKMKASELGDRLSDGFDSIATKSSDRLSHAANAMKDAMPSSDSVKSHVYDMKAQVRDAIPSSDEMKSRVADLQSQMPSSDDIASSLPSINDIKSRAQDLKDRVTDRIGHLKDAVNSGVEQLKDRVGGVGQQGEATTHGRTTINVPAHEPGTPPHMHTIPVHQA